MAGGRRGDGADYVDGGGRQVRRGRLRERAAPGGVAAGGPRAHGAQVKPSRHMLFCQCTCSLRDMPRCGMVESARSVLGLRPDPNHACAGPQDGDSRLSGWALLQMKVSSAEELAGIGGKGTKLLQISRSTPLLTAALIGHKQARSRASSYSSNVVTFLPCALKSRGHLHPRMSLVRQSGCERLAWLVSAGEQCGCQYTAHRAGAAGRCTLPQPHGAPQS